MKPNANPIMIAIDELYEETGILIQDPTRLEFCGEAQPVSTPSTHTSSLYRVQLTDNEFELTKESATSKTIFGVGSDTEKTMIEIVNLRDINKVSLDYSMRGMIAVVL